MFRPRAFVLISTLMLAAAAAVLACSSATSPNTCTGGGNPALIGTYDLLAFLSPPIDTLTPPVATGTLVLTAGTYSVDVFILDQNQVPQHAVDDSGTYMVGSNGTINQCSVNVQQPQFAGAYTYVGSTLTVSGSAAQIPIYNQWLHQ